MAEPSTVPGLTLADANTAKLRDFETDYEVGQSLRSGSFGKVFTTRHKITNEEYAVKVVDRTKLKPNDDANTMREIEIMKDLIDVPHIVKLVDVYIDPKTYFIVQIFAEGGDVFDRLGKRTAYTERDARELSTTLLQTLDAMHKLKICHRDLKPENLLLKGKWDDAAIMLADFGFAKHIPNEGLKTRCGTPAFVAPEIIKGQVYNQQVDMWSCGCLIFMIIGGYPPFQDESHRGLFRKIRAADYTFHKKYWSNVSVDAKQLIAGLLTVNPKSRLTCQDALQTEWLEIDETKLSSRDLSSSIAELKSFNARRKFKSAITAVFWSVASTFRHDKISDLMSAMDKRDESSGSTYLPASEDAKPEKFKMSHMHKKKFSEFYELGDKIHGGTFAIVYACVHKHSNCKYAVKVIQRDGKPETDEAVLHEVSVMARLDHQNIVEVLDFFEEDEQYYIVMELLAGGDVFDRIIDSKSYTEYDARKLARFMLETVGYMHSQGIAHRDIKPQNLLLVSKEDNAMIKVADFGFAKRVHTPKSLTSRCGTPSYVAPEILNSMPYDQMCDMWSCGVVLYSLLCGYTPFADDNQEAMFARVKAGDFEFYDEEWSHISQDAKDLIAGLLQVNPDDRLSAAAALESPWFAQTELMLSERNLSQTVAEIKKRRPRLRDLARAFMGLSFPRNVKKSLEVIHSRPTSAANSRQNSDENSAIKIV